MGKGTHKAIDRAQFFCKKFAFFLKCDIRKFYDSIDHDILLKIIRNRVKDKRLIELPDSIIDSGNKGIQESKGLPIGNLTSQHFADLYLDRLDHFVKEELKCRGYIRYMDDFILFSDDKPELKSFLRSFESMLFDERQLRLKESATIIGKTIHGIPFLGFSIFPNLRRIRRDNLKRFTKRIHRRERQYLNGLLSKEKLIHSVNSSIAHFSHGNTLNLRKKLFEFQAFDL